MLALVAAPVVIGAVAGCGVPNGARMIPVQTVAPPRGALEFCAGHAGHELCTVPLTPARVAELRATTATIKDSFDYTTDQQLYGRTEVWTTPKQIDGRWRGDCEDLALILYEALRARGWPRQALRLGVCATPLARGRPFDHAVLTVHTDRGVFILDTTHTDVTPIEHFPCRAWRIQRPGAGIADPWVAMRLAD